MVRCENPMRMTMNAFFQVITEPSRVQLKVTDDMTTLKQSVPKQSRFNRYCFFFFSGKYS